jgi:hypothetical protein
MGVGPIIRPRANARTDRGPPERRISAAIPKMFGEKGWSMFMGYGRRWAVETALSTYKRPYGEHCMSRKIENIERELKMPCGLILMVRFSPLRLVPGFLRRYGAQ